MLYHIKTLPPVCDDLAGGCPRLPLLAALPSAALQPAAPVTSLLFTRSLT
jgi:hypothetical protein